MVALQLDHMTERAREEARVYFKEAREVFESSTAAFGTHPLVSCLIKKNSTAQRKPGLGIRMDNLVPLVTQCQEV